MRSASRSFFERQETTNYKIEIEQARNLRALAAKGFIEVDPSLEGVKTFAKAHPDKFWVLSAQNFRASSFFEDITKELDIKEPKDEPIEKKPKKV